MFLTKSRAILLSVLILVVGACLGRFDTSWLFAKVEQFNGSASTPAPYQPAINNDTADKTEVSCPKAQDAIVIVGFGQSNSANHLGQRSKAASEHVVNFYQGKCYVAQDPMLGATGYWGSIWIPVAEGLQQSKPVVLVTFGVGGTRVAQWLDPQQLSGFYQSNIEALKAVYLNPDFLVWIQGESDVQTDPQRYKTQLVEWFERVKGDFPHSRLLTSGTSYCNGHQSTDIVAVQREVADEVGAHFIGSTDPFNAVEDRFDDCHFSGLGIQKVSQLVIRAIQTDLDNTAK